jgi:hypothetical protein
MKERMEGAPKYLEDRDPHNTTTEGSPQYQNGMVHHNITQSEMVRRCPKYYMIKKRQRNFSRCHLRSNCRDGRIR